LTALWQQYVRPASLEEALQALKDAPGPTCPIAGGTDLLLELRQGRKPAVHTLVDISAIPDLTGLYARGAELFIGAAVPHSQIIRSPLVERHARALVEACDLIGGPQVRNVATLGGNVGHALPAADGAIALLALGATAEVASLSDEESAKALTTNHDDPLVVTASAVLRRVPLLDLYLGPGKTALKPGQILTGFYLPLAEAGQGSAFRRVMCSQGVALAVVNLAAWVRRDGEAIADVRIAIGPAGPIPLRASAAETILRGREPTPENLAAAEAALLAESHFRTSPRRATAGYRRHLAGNLLAETISKAWLRAV
jgi:xanthine dehydrogenase FAD-binding subunit